ncbi:MAG: S1 RNA-binding domain-containing protein, partial [Capnocytophaga ochracea]
LQGIKQLQDSGIVPLTMKDSSPKMLGDLYDQKSAVAKKLGYSNVAEAIEAVNAVKFEPVEGETYTVKVVRLVEFGAFVEFVPGKDSLLHISEVSWDRVDKIEDSLKEGDIIEVKYLGIDPKTKKTRVSRKALLPRPPREDRPKSDKPYNDKPRNDRNKGHNNHQKPRQE